MLCPRRRCPVQGPGCPDLGGLNFRFWQPGLPECAGTPFFFFLPRYVPLQMVKTEAPCQSAVGTVVEILWYTA